MPKKENTKKISLKEKETEKEVEAESPTLAKKYNKEIYLVLGAMALLVLIFFAFYYVFGSLNKIDYRGLTFTKEKFGEIPVFHHYYYITPDVLYNLYLRNDPRNNKVPITGAVVDRGIEFMQKSTIYLTIAPDGIVGCPYGSVGVATLASFLVDNQFTVKGASSDKEQAELNNLTYATCKTDPMNKVIMIQGGNETIIEHRTPNCYVITVANCEILPAVEKFEVQAVLDAQARRAAAQKS